MTKENRQSERLSARATSSRSLVTALFLVAIIIVLSLLGSFAGRVTAQIPTAVELIYFRGDSDGDVAYLEWETATEQDTAGFRLERARNASGPYSPVEGYEFVVASGSVASGATYEATDDTVLSGQIYWYKLVEITSANVTGEEWTYELQIEQAEPTGEVVGGGRSTPVATNTVAPTSTTEPTATSATTGGATSSAGTSVATSAATGAATNTRVSNNTGSSESRSTTDTPAPTNTPRPTNTPGSIATPTRFASRAPASPTPSTAAIAGAGASAGSPTANAELLVQENSLTTSTVTPTPAEAAAVAQAAEGDVRVGAAEELDDGEEVPIVGRRSVGSGAEADATAPESGVAQQEGESSRLLLWLGFIAAFLIFVGGVAFSIFLSTRKRSDDSS